MRPHEIQYHNLVISPPPHIHAETSYTVMMYTWAAALLPAAIYAIVLYGMHAARVISLAVASAIGFELIIQKLFKQPVTAHDGTALCTGLLFAMILPPSAPWWLVLVGTFVAILIGRQIFGGVGGNPMNPVLIGWAAVRLSWEDYCTFDYAALNYRLPFSFEYPLSLLGKAGTAGIEGFSYHDLLLGKQVGGIGAAAVLLILMGGLFLIVRGVVSWRIPAAFLLGVAATSLIFWRVNPAVYANPLFHLLTGNVMIGAFFLATEYSSSPVNKTAMLLYGLGCGIFTVLFRAWSYYMDGVPFAILVMNIAAPLLDRIQPSVRAIVRVKEPLS